MENFPTFYSVGTDSTLYKRPRDRISTHKSDGLIGLLKSNPDSDRTDIRTLASVSCGEISPRNQNNILFEKRMQKRGIVLRKSVLSIAVLDIRTSRKLMSTTTKVGLVVVLRLPSIRYNRVFSTIAKNRHDVVRHVDGNGFNGSDTLLRSDLRLVELLPLTTFINTTRILLCKTMHFMTFITEIAHSVFQVTRWTSPEVLFNVRGFDSLRRVNLDCGLIGNYYWGVNDTLSNSLGRFKNRAQNALRFTNRSKALRFMLTIRPVSESATSLVASVKNQTSSLNGIRIYGVGRFRLITLSSPSIVSRSTLSSGSATFKGVRNLLSCLINRGSIAKKLIIIT